MDVLLSRKAQKQLRKIPKHIIGNLETWIALVETDGLEEARKTPGYHDEPLKGDREGQRSIRLNRAYRAIYEECEWEDDYEDDDDDSDRKAVRFVSVEEVNKHDY